MKIRSYIGNTLLATCVSLLLLTTAAGCTQEEWTGEGNGPVGTEFTLLKTTISATGIDDPNTLGPAEYAIHQARIVVFEPGSTTQVDTTLLVHNSPGELASGTMTIDMKIKKKGSDDRRRNILVIANETSRMTGILETPGQKDWTQIRKTCFYGRDEYLGSPAISVMHDKADNISTFNTGFFRLPMTGEGEIDLSGSSASASISLRRTMARVDVYLQENLDAQQVATRYLALNLYTFHSSGLLIHQGLTDITFPNSPSLEPATMHGVSPSPAYLPTGNSSNYATNARRMFSIYLPEREFTDGAPTSIGFDAYVEYPGGAEVRKTYRTLSIPYPGVEGSQHRWIARNTLYKVYATFTSAETIKIENITITPWNEVNIDTPIEKFNFLISQSELRLDYGAFGNSFTGTVTFKSDKGVGYVGMFHENGNAVTNETWPNYFVRIDGRPDGVQTEGTISIQYRVAENPSPPFYVRLKSGNITKDIKVVYDNGFLPRSYFPGGTADIPAALEGVQLAKIGNKTPNEVAMKSEEMLPWTRAAEQNTPVATSKAIGAGRTNTEAILNTLQVSLAGSCKNMADRSGKTWYLPSLNEIEFLPVAHIFGPSYHVELETPTGGQIFYWTSSTASDDSGFMNTAYSWSRGTAVFDFKTDQRRVRCIQPIYTTP
ncbi:hypothetical protein [Parabacteroides gordonii]|uniref:hypothetical protein n=1 Tax=Parabacteroides gordonii TaxID=574930 RepID=UPI0026F04AE5|nr:hypothetical protein [Parabacteroides gordonii]